MSKRDLVLSLLEQNQSPNYIPGAFFLHFDPSFHKGEAAVKKHLEFFHYTGMDIVKIQYEHHFPTNIDLRTPRDWLKVPVYKEDFFEEPLYVIKRLVEQAKKDALVIVTLYSPFMIAGQINGQEVITRHIIDDPNKAKVGLAAVTESMLNFVRACVRYGVDGFYTSTQGAEEFRFPSLEPFYECIKPFDLEIMREVNQTTLFNILHVCDYHGGYADLTQFYDYPGDIVNSNLQVGSEKFSPKKISSMFHRPFMGGLERKSIIATGTKEQIENEVVDIIKKSPDQFFLAADCTVPSETNWDNLKTAIDTAHHYKKA